MSYHYVLASLPMMFFGDPPPIRSVEWRRQLQNVLPEQDLTWVDAFLEGRLIQGCRFADEWWARETQLRNAIALARAARLGTEARSYRHEHPGFDMQIEDAVTNAFTKDNPLERARELDRCRWHIADDLARPEPFGLAPILAFAIHLRIAEYWASLQDEDGQKAVEQFVSAHARWENTHA